MAEPTSTPRVTAQYLDAHAGKHVMIVGNVIQLRGDSAVIDSQGNVSITLNRASTAPTSHQPLSTHNSKYFC
jgi:replication factor A3